MWQKICFFRCYGSWKGIPYDYVKFIIMKIIRISIPNTCGIKGDCYDRFMIRVAEMRQSCSIIAQVCDRIKDGFITVPCKIC